MYSYLEKIGPIMIASLKSTEGIVVCFDADNLFFIMESSVVFFMFLVVVQRLK